MSDIPKTPIIEILYITWNRLAYTTKTLPAVLNNTNYPFKLTIIDNGSTDGTQEYLKLLKDHPKVKNIIYKPENIGISPVTNEFWQSLDNETNVVGKVDNDNLVPSNWLERLVPFMEREFTIHKEPIGVVSLSHFHEDDCARIEKIYDIIKYEIKSVHSGAQFINTTNVGGTPYLVRRSRIANHTLRVLSHAKNPMKSGWTEVQWALNAKGYKHGYVWPMSENIARHLDDFRYPESLDPRVSELLKNKKGNEISALKALLALILKKKGRVLQYDFDPDTWTIKVK